MPEIILHRSDSGKKQSLSVGDTISVKLSEGPTGYRWIEKISNTGVLQPQGSSFSPPPDSGGIGGMGVRIFSFLGKSIGTSSIQMKLVRPWDENDIGDLFEIFCKVD